MLLFWYLHLSSGLEDFLLGSADGTFQNTPLHTDSKADSIYRIHGVHQSK